MTPAARGILIRKSAIHFGLAGVVVPFTFLLLSKVLPTSGPMVGGFSLGYWSLQCLLMLAPASPIIMTPSTTALDWIVPYALFFLGNVLIYIGLGVLSAVLAKRVWSYAVMVVVILFLLLLLSDEWYLMRWILGALPAELNSPARALEQLNAQYFLVVGTAVLAIFILRYVALRAELMKEKLPP